MFSHKEDSSSGNQTQEDAAADPQPVSMFDVLCQGSAAQGDECELSGRQSPTLLSFADRNLDNRDLASTA